MTCWKIAQGSQAVRPEEFDTTASAVVVYQRRNIERITVKNYDGSTTELWQYEERQMTHEEYVEMQLGQNRADIAEMRPAASIAFVTLAEAGQIDDTTVTENAGQFAAWAYPVEYKAGAIREYEGVLFRCNQQHTSQADWTPPAAVSLWSKIGDPMEEWPEWAQPIGAQDAYNSGDKVSHNGRHWVSDLDGNVWEPGVYGWTEEPDI